MSSQATLSSKGQITIPQEVREQLGLKTGDKVEFVAEAGRWSIRPVRQSQNPFESYAGALGAFENVDEVNAWLSDLRDE
jgi:AbrB family looped-hinge helix DNA binding protein